MYGNAKRDNNENKSFFPPMGSIFYLHVNGMKALATWTSEAGP